MGSIILLDNHRDSPTVAAIRRRMIRNTERAREYEAAGDVKGLRRALHRHAALCRELREAFAKEAEEARYGS